MRRIIVKRLHWIDEDDFFELFAACNLIPGPSSTELAILLGYKQAGKRGLILAGACFILPAMVIMMALARVYQLYGTTAPARHVLVGVTAVVVGILAWAVLDISRRLVRDAWAVATAAAVAIVTLFYVNPIACMAAGGVLFFLRARLLTTRPREPKVTMMFLPVLSASSILNSKLAVLFATFLKLGFIAFGSGYVLLVFLRAEFVVNLHWLSQRQIVDAIAISQATPGPVFTTATFVGYLVSGVPGGLLATLAIFAPGFVLVPPLERFVRFVARHPALREALKGVNVAALGLIAGVSLEVARSAVTSPGSGILAAATFLVLLRRPLAAPAAVVAGGVLGLAWPGLITGGIGL
jgi:chromate transporter